MMKLKIFLLSALLVPTFSLFAQSFYNPSDIQVIEINFTQSNWDYLLDSLVSFSEDERLLGTATINGLFYDSIGVRYKGNSSYSASQVKNPLNIKLDYHINNQETPDGYGTIKLSNVMKDPSFLREVLGYEIARKYFPASLANYAKVTINGTYLGLYTNVQDVDKLFCRMNFGEDDGVRVKGEINGMLPGSSWTVWQYLGADSSLYSNKYKIESDFGWNRLIGFLDTLNNQNTLVHEKLNIDRHLWFLAFSNLTVNLDGPINNPQNYYLYQDASGRFNPIPWDFNECFGVFTQLYNSPPMNQTALIQLNPLLNLSNSNYPIISKILSNSLYKKIYLAHYKTIIEENFQNGWYYNRALELQNLISTEVQNDPNKLYSYAYFTSNLTSSVGSGPQAFIGITQLMDARATWLFNQSAFQSVSPDIQNITIVPDAPVNGQSILFKANLENADIVYLKYRKIGQLIFQEELMVDDGNHEDGAAGDGEFACILPAQVGGLEYYILAENADAVRFDPPRAEYEFYTLMIKNDLVINEFSASNTTYPDQDGEMEDWIELYNNGDDAISLGGYFLSDDMGNPKKWMFPDTLLAPGGYLIIWADEDETQVGLHASFKLSKSGESLLLSDTPGNVIDYLHFSEQKTDTAYGRSPNGIGAFTSLIPTPGAENGASIGIVEFADFAPSGHLLLGQNYPNPAEGRTIIPYYLPYAESVELAIVNLSGQIIYYESSGFQSAGAYEISVNTENLHPGVYFYRIRAGKEVYLRRMIVI